ncbi:MAG: PqqD family protein [Chloroflexota bacterium]|nr:PqqD family protein [Chloroflexota bacterium]
MNNKPIRRKDVTCKQLDEAETVLYDPKTDVLHILNPTARLIWELCDGEHTIEDMTAAIEAQYTGTEGKDILSEVQRTLDTFTTQDLLQTVS